MNAVRGLSVAMILAAWVATAAGADYVWIEGEKPTTRNIEAKASGWGNKEYLSGEQWLNVAIEERNVAASVPEGGVVLRYEFESPSAGEYEVWNRIGYEFVRSPFEWRIDQNTWQEVLPIALTTDLMDISLWCEVAWLKMGTANLAKGKHALEVRLPKVAGKRILYASDALCLYRGTFRPNGKFKPDEAWQQDADKAAAKQVFEMKASGEAGDRVELPLGGTWQIARSDEQVIDDRSGPIKALPKAEELYWKAIAVPADRNDARPELVFCHRYFYRTQVKVPAEMKGRSFFLHFPAVNMIATVFVNGTQCGWTKAPFAMWDCDVTQAIRPGEVNEIWVGIKDTYYGLASDTRRGFNIPPSVMDSNQGVSMRLDFPVWHHRQNGILEMPTLVAAGPVYTGDVFAMPSVKKKQLGLEVTLRNPTGKPAEIAVAHEVVPVEGGAAEMRVAPHLMKLVGDGHAMKLNLPWADPKLWWPDAPQQYYVVTTVSMGGKVVDRVKTKFGFREWSWDGPQFKLNGVPWQGRADLTHHSTNKPDEAIATWRKHGQTMFRFWATQWGGMGMGQTLDFMDKNGMPVRRSGILDGEMASYGLSEEAEVDGKKVRRARKDLFDNWLVQLKAQVKGERNHPSIFVWSIENEVVFINSLNLGQADWVEPAVAAVAREVMKTDPTRPAMVDGGQALTDESLPVVGGHYLETEQRDYPDQAYTLDKLYGVKSRGRWPTPKDRPILMGESFFARGYNPAWFAGIGGEAAFLGRSETIWPCGMYAKMLSEGYRWHGVAGFHYWFGGEDASLHYNSWQPVCVLSRQWNWTFGGGTSVLRTLKVFNDTRYADPIELAWQLKLEGKVVDEGKKACAIAPGLTEVIEVTVKVPAVAKRTAGEFVLTCSRGGKEVFREMKPAAAINASAAAKPSLTKADLLVLDPKGAAKARLAARGVEFTEVARFEDIPAQVKALVVGHEALTARQATDPKWLSLVAAGARILVLDQATPLHYQAVPADFEPTQHVGRIAFAENLEHPIFAGLAQGDFFTWSGDHIVYRNVYKKASKGARSLVQCDRELSCSALAECPVNDGLLLLCQMVVGEKLASDPVAQVLFDNMLNYLASYRVVRNEAAVVMDDASPERKMLGASGLKFDQMGDPLSALTDGKHAIVVMNATPANLKALAGSPDKVKAFTERGGWVMLWGLTPEGLADYNKVVGVNHLLRPFEMERVTLPAVRDPILSGLTMRDVVMESGQKIAAHVGDKFLASDVFTHVVDLDDIAPFCEIPGPEYFNDPGATPGSDRWPRNMFNGFLSSDSWKYVFSIHLMNNDPTTWTMKLPREEEVIGFSIAVYATYHKITKINLYFDDEKTPVTINTRPVSERQDFVVPNKKAKTIRVELADWEKSGRVDVVGIENMWVRVKRPDDFPQRVRPLLNLGALVKYPMGKGGIILNQLLIPANESVPVNAQKKQTIVSTLLRNLGAIYAGGKTLTAGDLKFRPISLDNQCNQYLTKDRGWFDSARDLAHLPGGENRFGEVTFAVQDFKTSPVPGCIMLAGPGVKGRMPREFKGLKVDRKADALFFLHAFKQTDAWRPRRPEDAPPVVFKYVINYADGTSAEAPVVLGEGVGHWISGEPKGLKNAAVAWAAKFPGDESGEQAVLYQMQWANSRPEVAIKSIDLVYDGQTGSRYGVPALIAVSAGER